MKYYKEPNEETEDLKNLERVLLVFLSISILAIFVPSFMQGTWFFGLMLCILGLFYGFTGFWFFRKNGISKIQAFGVGFIFCISLYILSWAVDSEADLLSKIFFVPLTILVMILIPFMWKNRNNLKVKVKYWRIFTRAIVIFGFTNLFLFTPITFKPYRKLLIFMYQGNDNYILHNLEAYDYKIEGDEALDEGNCNDAIRYAEKSYKAALKWKGIKSMNEYNSRWSNEERFVEGFDFDDDIKSQILEITDFGSFRYVELREIEGAFEVLFDAYLCKAEDYIHLGKTNDAILYLSKALTVSKDFNEYTSSWNRREIGAYRYLSQCYSEIEDYALADSIYIECFHIIDREEKLNIELVDGIFRDLRSYISKRKHYEGSQKFYTHLKEHLDITEWNVESVEMARLKEEVERRIHL